MDIFTVDTGYRGIPGKEMMRLNIGIALGWRYRREIRFGALGTNRLLSVVFVVREL